MELVEGELLACVLTLWFAKYSSFAGVLVSRVSFPARYSQGEDDQ